MSGSTAGGVHRKSDVQDDANFAIQLQRTENNNYDDEEEEYDEDKNGQFRSLFILPQNLFACLQGQFRVGLVHI